jgi:hypothetical protein
LRFPVTRCILAFLSHVGEVRSDGDIMGKHVSKLCHSFPSPTSIWGGRFRTVNTSRPPRTLKPANRTDSEAAHRHLDEEARRAKPRVWATDGLLGEQECHQIIYLFFGQHVGIGPRH